MSHAYNSIMAIIICKFLKAINPLNFLWILVHLLSRDLQESEWFFQTDHPFRGWEAIFKFNLVPKTRCILGHSLEVNLGSWSDTIDIGTPCNVITSLTFNFTNLFTRFVIFIGKNKVTFVKWYIITHIT